MSTEQSSKDVFQDSDFISKEEVGTPQIRTHVDRVASGVAIVDDNFDNVVVAYDVGVCVLAVNNGIGGLVTGVENSEESRDFGFYVGYVVDCEARGVISHCLLALRAKGFYLPILVKIHARLNIECNPLSDRLEEGLLIVWDETEIIVESTGIRRECRLCFRQRLGGVVNEISSSVKRNARTRITVKHIRIHGANKGIVLAWGTGLSGDKHTVPLTSRNIDQVGTLLDCVNAVNFDDSHLMLIELEKERGKIGDTEWIRSQHFL